MEIINRKKTRTCPNRCAASFCGKKNNNRIEDGKYISFHKIPLRKSVSINWIKFCKRNDNWNPKFAMVCSRHFLDSDFITSGYSSKPLLHPDAFPTVIGIKENTENDLISVSSNENISESLEEYENIEYLDEDKSMTDVSTDLNYELAKKDNEISEKNKEILNLNLKVEELQHEIKKLKQYNNCKFEYKLEQIGTDESQVILTKNRIKWEKEDIEKALTMRLFSMKCYMYFKEMSYPLPSLQCLRNYITQINIQKGILNDILFIMQIYGRALRKQEKICILQFGEMKCREIYEYDTKNDEILGPYKYMQVIQVQSLLSSWKQVIYVDFDTGVTDQMLLKIITELHEIGFNVVGCVSDLGTTNQTLWNTMNVFYDGNCYFLHPRTNKKIFVFPDTQYLIKLIRNWLIDTGFLLEGGEIINIDPIYELIEKYKNKMKSSSYLTKNHLTVQDEERENFSIAVELLSHHTSKYLRKYIKRNDAEDLADFIEIINNWYDLMNSCNLNEKIILKKPFGINLEIQNETLQNMYDMINGCRCIGTTTLQIFQKGILLSINSLRELLQDLKLEYNIEFMLTHRINNDSLENLFSQIKTKGEINDIPSPMDCLSRMKMIFFGINKVKVGKNTNNLDITENLPYLVEDFLKQTCTKIQSIKEKLTKNDLIIEPDFILPSSVSNKNQETETDDIKYLTEWIPKKFNDKFTYLVNCTYKNDHDYMVSDVSNLSSEILYTPSDQWLNQALILEKFFKRFHKDTFNTNRRKIVKSLAAKIFRKYNGSFNLNIIENYIYKRTYIRMKFLNKKYYQK